MFVPNFYMNSCNGVNLSEGKDPLFVARAMSRRGIVRYLMSLKFHLEIF